MALVQVSEDVKIKNHWKNVQQSFIKNPLSINVNKTQGFRVELQVSGGGYQVRDKTGIRQEQ